MYQVSETIYIGPFVSPKRLDSLREAEISHVLNVSEAASVIGADGSPVRELAWHPLFDLEPILIDAALACLSTLHRMVCEPSARVYVHCIAGQNRSPTVVWLYFIACGISPDDARELIERRVPDSVPGHSELVSVQLIAAAQAHGQRHFLPHPRQEVLAGVAGR